MTKRLKKKRMKKHEQGMPLSFVIETIYIKNYDYNLIGWNFIYIIKIKIMFTFFLNYCLHLYVYASQIHSLNLYSYLSFSLLKSKSETFIHSDSKDDKILGLHWP